MIKFPVMRSRRQTLFLVVTNADVRVEQSLHDMFPSQHARLHNVLLECLIV